jgi:hypothetical protein
LGLNVATEIQLKRKESVSMLWAIAGVLLVLWLVGLLGGVGGSLVHVLLVLAGIIIMVNLLRGWRRRT